jgi:hypothetical protein
MPVASSDTPFPYTPVPNGLRDVLTKLPGLGTPEKATQEWLASIGYSGGNHKRSLAVMRSVGIIGPSGVPTEFWAAIRGEDRPKVAAFMRKRFADLFSTYPDADRKDDEALISFVRSKTNYGDTAQQLAVRTFKVLCAFGDFGAESVVDLPDDDEADEEPTPKSPAHKKTPSGQTAVDSEGAGRVALTVNLQIQLPASEDGEVYDKLFAAMGKHLRGLVSGT